MLDVYTFLIQTTVELSIFVDIIISGLAENEILVDVAFDFRIFFFLFFKSL